MVEARRNLCGASEGGLTGQWEFTSYGEKKGRCRGQTSNAFQGRRIILAQTFFPYRRKKPPFQRCQSFRSRSGGCSVFTGTATNQGDSGGIPGLGVIVAGLSHVPISPTPRRFTAGLEPSGSGRDRNCRRRKEEKKKTGQTACAPNDKVRCRSAL